MPYVTEAQFTAAGTIIGNRIKARTAGTGGAVTGVHAREPGLVAGSYLSQQINSSALTTVAAAAGRLDFMPFIPAKNITVNELAIEITTLLAGGQGRLGIYASDASGNPAAKLVEGAAVFTTDAVGAKTLALANTSLNAGSVYWLAVHSSGTQTYRGVAVAALFSLGHTATLNTSHTVRRATVAFAGGLPANAPATVLTATIAPWFRMKIA
jgi:hypothetical protein